MITNDDLKWVLVDLDKTIAQNDEKYNLLEPVEGIREILLDLEALDFKIHVYTARPWADYQMIEGWLENFAIPYRRIICGKPLAKYIIDDRAFNPYCEGCKDKLWKETGYKMK